MNVTKVREKSQVKPKFHTFKYEVLLLEDNKEKLIQVIARDIREKTDEDRTANYAVRIKGNESPLNILARVDAMINVLFYSIENESVLSKEAMNAIRNRIYQTSPNRSKTSLVDCSVQPTVFIP